MIVRPVSGSVPSSRSPLGWASSSSAFSTVSSSGASSGGTLRAVLAALHVGAVAPDAQHDVAVGNREAVDGARVDLAERAHECLETLGAVVAVVERAQPVDPLLLAGRDPVEVVLHAGGEAVVDEP